VSWIGTSSDPLGAITVPVVDEWPEDPYYDWPRHFRQGDVVRLDDGRVAIVSMILDCAPEPPPRWELVVTAIGSWGGPDDFITEPWLCRPAPEAIDEARHLGLRR
jgi:hypothetical protein